MNAAYLEYDDEGYVTCPSCRTRITDGEGLTMVETFAEELPTGEVISVCMCEHCSTLMQVHTADMGGGG